VKQLKEMSSEEIDASLVEDLRALKKKLKNLSKNQLIALVFDQMNRYMEQKQANEALMEKMGVTNEDNS
jgi:hypothetical protein